MDTFVPSVAELAGDPEIVGRAEKMRPLVAAAAAEIEDGRRLPTALLDKLHEQKLFRLLLPRSLDGIETDPITLFNVIETIARADASTAWCMSQAGGCAMTAAYLDPAVARQMFGGPRDVLAWGPAFKSKIVECEGGYKVTGTWAFASGGRHATWLGAVGQVSKADGTPKLDERGRPVERTLLVPASAVQWTDIWNVVGLRGTASDQFALTDHFVPAGFSFSRDYHDPAHERRESGALYRFSAMTCYEVGFAGVALGIARGALDDFADAAKSKVVRGGKAPIRDNAVVQANFAQSEVNVRSARAYLLQSVADIWKTLSADNKLTVEQRITIRMASTNAIHKAREAVDSVYNAMGATAIFENQPMERRFRDIHTVTQQLQGRLSHFETVGAWMLGAEADLTFV
jgi:alkylation response protein AidB-like acyl-CoA dehydrogenase